jgi:prolyl-tRNA synthetase
VAFAEVSTLLPALLDIIHDSMYAAAKRGRDEKMVTVTEWKDFVPALEKQCLVMTPFCDEREWEEKVKTMSREESLKGQAEAATTATSVAAKTLCKPFDQPALPEGTLCFVSGKPATTWVLWGRSY